MTDQTPWQSPSGSTPPAGEPFPADGSAAAGGAARPGSPQPGAPQPGAAPGWTPPPKPGLIPLRPLTLGTMLAAAFQVLRRNPRPMFGFALLVMAGVTLVSLAVVGVVAFFAVTRMTTATGADADAIAAGSIAAIALSALVPVVLSLCAGALLQGIVVLEVARGTVGEKLRLGALWRAAKGRIGALIGWTLLVTTVVVLALGITGVLIGLIIAFGGTAGLVAGILLAIGVVAGAVVLGFWLGTRLCLVPSVLMLERLPLRAALSRSWSLTRGYFWRTLGIQLLVSVIVQVVTAIISTPLQILLGFGSALINPNGDETGLIVTVVVLYLITIVVAVVFGAIAAVVQAATTSLIYIDIRMRKEGLDLELTRFVEARQAGDSSVADPYLVGARIANAPGAGTVVAPSPWS